MLIFCWSKCMSFQTKPKTLCSHNVIKKEKNFFEGCKLLRCTTTLFTTLSSSLVNEGWLEGIYVKRTLATFSLKYFFNYITSCIKEKRMVSVIEFSDSALLSKFIGKSGFSSKQNFMSACSVQC